MLISSLYCWTRVFTDIFRYSWNFRNIQLRLTFGMLQTASFRTFPNVRRLFLFLRNSLLEVSRHTQLYLKPGTEITFDTLGYNVLYRAVIILKISQVNGRKEGNVLFNDALNTFYLRLYGVGHMVKDHSDSERGNTLPPHGLLAERVHLYVPSHIPRPLLDQSWSTGWNENRLIE